MVFDYPPPIKLAIMKVFIESYSTYKVLRQYQLRRRLLGGLRDKLSLRRTNDLVWRRTKLVRRRNELVGRRTELVRRRTHELHWRRTKLVRRWKVTNIHWLHHRNLRCLWVHNNGYLRFVFLFRL